MIKMQTIVIVAGFVVLLALLLYFLYQEKEVEEELEPMTIEKAKPDVIKAEEWDKEVRELREEEMEDSETIEPEVEETEIDVEEDLEELEGVGPTYRRLLRAAEIKSIKSLADQEPDSLLEKMNEINEKEEITKRPPTPENVKDWIEKAKTKS
jgi:predicted flap endonuclease-1-like 5' DNA nuclease